MYSYVSNELISMAEDEFPIIRGLRAIAGHSMGGHGALVTALRNVDRFASVSAFAPLTNPTACPWGQSVFKTYLGSVEAGSEYDATRILESKGPIPNFPIKITQGSNDYYNGKAGGKIDQLKPESIVEVAERIGQLDFELTWVDGDHSYKTIAKHIDQHLLFHAVNLRKQATRKALFAVPRALRVLRDGLLLGRRSVMSEQNSIASTRNSISAPNDKRTNLSKPTHCQVPDTASQTTRPSTHHPRASLGDGGCLAERLAHQRLNDGADVPEVTVEELQRQVTEQSIADPANYSTLSLEQAALTKSFSYPLGMTPLSRGSHLRVPSIGHGMLYTASPLNEHSAAQASGAFASAALAAARRSYNADGAETTTDAFSPSPTSAARESFSVRRFRSHSDAARSVRSTRRSSLHSVESVKESALDSSAGRRHASPSVRASSRHRSGPVTVRVQIGHTDLSDPQSSPNTMKTRGTASARDRSPLQYATPTSGNLQGRVPRSGAHSNGLCSSRPSFASSVSSRAEHERILLQSAGIPSSPLPTFGAAQSSYSRL